MLSVLGMAGPTAIDDWVQIALRFPGSPIGAILAYAAPITHGATSATGIIGIDEHGRYYPQLYPQTAAGTTVTVELYQFHANFSIVAGPITYTGFTWDPLGELGQLAALSASAVALPAGILQEIRDAVYRPFPVN